MITKAKTDFECKRCGHLWNKKQIASPKPVSCPKCKSYKWNQATTSRKGE